MSRNGTEREPHSHRVVVVGAGMAAGRLAQRLATTAPPASATAPTPTVTLI
ncbi:hypothetical protein G5C51_34865, partial [Streptomyces sp. A7024]|nr:hypothetical protein [Streptomyces coryli]